MRIEVITPDWPAPTNVCAFTTTRMGGLSKGPWKSMNLGWRCGDDEAAVSGNREALNQRLPGPPQWLHQVHGTGVVAHPGVVTEELEGDALISTAARQVCAVLTADCLPVLFCDLSGRQVAVAHAGWRGLANGVLKTTVEAMGVNPAEIIAWLGPAIGPAAYEVGKDVKQAFEKETSGCLAPRGDRWLLNLYEAARQHLADLGVSAVFGGDFCTFTDAGQFFSYRRDGVTGRMASLIWTENI